MDNNDDWRFLDIDFDLYKFYLELLLKVALFAFGVTGAMVSFYLLHYKEPLMVYSLVLPLIINGGFSILCIFSVPLAKILDKDHRAQCEIMKFTAYDFLPSAIFVPS